MHSSDESAPAKACKHRLVAFALLSTVLFWSWSTVTVAQTAGLDNPWSVEPNRPYPKRTPTPPLVDPNPSRPSRPVP